MNKRRMKYNSYNNIRKCIDVLNGKLCLIGELPPGGVYWGPPNGRDFDTFEGRTDAMVVLDTSSRKRVELAGRKDSCYSTDSSRW